MSRWPCAFADERRSGLEEGTETALGHPSRSGFIGRLGKRLEEQVVEMEMVPEVGCSATIALGAEKRGGGRCGSVTAIVLLVQVLLE